MGREGEEREREGEVSCKMTNRIEQILGKVRCPYPGDPPHGRIAPLKFWYKPGDNIQVSLNNALECI